MVVGGCAIVLFIAKSMLFGFWWPFEHVPTKTVYPTVVPQQKQIRKKLASHRDPDDIVITWPKVILPRNIQPSLLSGPIHTIDVAHAVTVVMKYKLTDIYILNKHKKSVEKHPFAIDQGRLYCKDNTKNQKYTIFIPLVIAESGFFAPLFSTHDRLTMCGDSHVIIDGHTKADSYQMPRLDRLDIRMHGNSTLHAPDIIIDDFSIHLRDNAHAYISGQSSKFSSSVHNNSVLIAPDLCSKSNGDIGSSGKSICYIGTNTWHSSTMDYRR